MLENDSIDDSDDDLLGCGIDRDNLINFRAVGRPKNPGGGASSNVVGIICPPPTALCVEVVFYAEIKMQN